MFRRTKVSSQPLGSSCEHQCGRQLPGEAPTTVLRPQPQARPGRGLRYLRGAAKPLFMSAKHATKRIGGLRAAPPLLVAPKPPPMPLLFFCLSMVNGWLDVLLLRRFGLFATMMMGNTLGASVEIARGHWGLAVFKAGALGCYLGGIIIHQIVDSLLGSAQAHRVPAALSAFVAGLFVLSDGLWHLLDPSDWTLHLDPSSCVYPVCVAMGAANSCFPTTLPHIMTGNWHKVSIAVFHGCCCRSRLDGARRRDALLSANSLGGFVSGSMSCAAAKQQATQHEADVGYGWVDLVFSLTLPGLVLAMLLALHTFSDERLRRSVKPRRMVEAGTSIGHSSLRLNSRTPSLGNVLAGDGVIASPISHAASVTSPRIPEKTAEPAAQVTPVRGIGKDDAVLGV